MDDRDRTPSIADRGPCPPAPGRPGPRPARRSGHRPRAARSAPPIRATGRGASDRPAWRAGGGPAPRRPSLARRRPPEGASGPRSTAAPAPGASWYRGSVASVHHGRMSIATLGSATACSSQRSSRGPSGVAIAPSNANCVPGLVPTWKPADPRRRSSRARATVLASRVTWARSTLGAFGERRLGLRPRPVARPRGAGRAPVTNRSRALLEPFEQPTRRRCGSRVPPRTCRPRR